MKGEQNGLIERLDWDSSFFGLPIGRVYEGVCGDQIGEVVGEAQGCGLRCVYLLVPAGDVELVVAAESHGFRMREIRIELERSVRHQHAASIGLRVAHAQDLQDLEPIARDRIRGTRFFADRRFSRERCAELYVEWLRRGITSPSERQTLVVGSNEGFVICHLDRCAKVGTIELIAVAEHAIGKGLGKALMVGADALFSEASLATARIVTQGSNITAQALYQACGYRTARVFYWLHLWL